MKYVGIFFATSAAITATLSFLFLPQTQFLAGIQPLHLRKSSNEVTLGAGKNSIAEVIIILF